MPKGDVAFWVTNTENVSGMKKRESKWDDFKNNPFEYEFMFAPLGDNGAYEYLEPWYGFAANKDYAVELLRFMARQEELNTMASVKGVPSAAKVSDDTRYVGISKAKTEIAIVNNGTLNSAYGYYICIATEKLVDGTDENTDAAFVAFLEDCKQILQTK